MIGMTKEEFEQRWEKANMPLNALHLIYLKGLDVEYGIRVTEYDFSTTADEVMLYLKNTWVACLPLSIISDVI